MGFTARLHVAGSTERFYMLSNIMVGGFIAPEGFLYSGGVTRRGEDGGPHQVKLKASRGSNSSLDYPNLENSSSCQK